MLLNDLERCLEFVRKIQAEAEQREVRVATAESCTGGLLASLLTYYPGSSRFYMGGICAYTNDAKMRLLSVPKKTIEEFGAVSEQTAEAMAKGALDKFNANFAMSITGIAGPEGGSSSKPLGTICCSYASPGRALSLTYSLGKDRTQNRSEVCALVLEEAYRLIQNMEQ